MASDVRPRPPAGGFEDYLPDDLADFAELLDDDLSEETAAQPKTGVVGLGIDEEVDMKKTAREPRVKLDESRLLSAKGIPALRQRARTLQLKGKGHEFSDAARLLSMYQLWLDDLFPKARFGDALVMVEKEGHKASMHKMRMEWINESKPRDAEDGEGGDAEDSQGVQNGEPPGQNGPNPLAAQLSNASPPTTPPLDDVPMDDIDLGDLYSATPLRPRPRPDAATEIPDEDELDALMAKAADVHEPLPVRPPPARAAAPMEAMDIPEDMDDLEALMAEAEAGL